MNKKKTLLISILILIVGAIVTVIVFSTEPEAQRQGATKKTAMLVDIVTVERDTFQPVIVATGTVQPTQDINLSPRVSGEILSRSNNFTPGGFVGKGEELLQIDPADYKNILQQRKSDLRQSMADLNIERGRQDVAQKDYQLVGDTLIDNLTAENKDLVLRQPQLESAQANVESAQAAVEQAELDLQRTTVRAPFDAHIITRNANVGSQVAPGDNLGRLVGIHEYWVVATVPLSKVSRLHFPRSEAEQGSKVKLINRNAWPEGQYRTGYLDKQVGALEDETRMVQVLVSVSDPLVYNTENIDKPPLMIGSFVETQIHGTPIPDVVRLNRDHIRKDETVWVMKDGALQIRQVDIVFEDSKYAYIRNGLDHNEQVVTTNLSTVVEGAPLRVEADTASSNHNKQTGGTP